MEVSTILKNLFPILKIFYGNFSSADIISSAGFSIIILVFSYFFIKLLSVVKNIKTNLERIFEILKDITPNTIVQNFESINSQLSRDSFIGHYWSKFTETLIRKNEGEPQIFSSIDIDYFFNENNLVFSKINLRLYSAIPGILTGLGILGTFVGLIFGLSQIDFNTTDVRKLKEGIIQLLAGTQISFSTSIWGILFSIIFLVSKSYYFKRLSEKANQLQNKIREVFIYKTPEHLLNDILWENQQQTTELKKFNEDLAINIAEALEEKMDMKLSPIFEEFSERLTEFMNHTISHLANVIKENQQQTSEFKKFNDELATNIATSIDERLNQSLTPIFDRLTNTIEHFTSIGTTEIVKAITSGAETGIERLNVTLNEVSENLQNIAVKTKEIQDELFEKFNYFINNLNKYQEELRIKFNDNIKQLTSNIEDVLIAQQEQIKSVNNELESRLSMFVEKIENETIAIVQKMEESNRILADYFKEIVEKAVEKYREEDEQIQNLLTQLKDISKQLEDTILSAGLAAEAFEKSSKPVKETLDKAIQTINDIKDFHVNFMQIFTNIKYSMEKHLKTMTEASDKILTALEYTQNSWRVYEEKFGEISEELAAIFDQLKEGLKEYSEITGENIYNILSKFDNQLKEAIGQLAGFVEGLEEAVEEMNEVLEKIHKIS